MNVAEAGHPLGDQTPENRAGHRAATDEPDGTLRLPREQSGADDRPCHHRRNCPVDPNPDVEEGEREGPVGQNSEPEEQGPGGKGHLRCRDDQGERQSLLNAKLDIDHQANGQGRCHHEVGELSSRVFDEDQGIPHRFQNDEGRDDREQEQGRETDNPHLLFA